MLRIVRGVPDATFDWRVRGGNAGLYASQAATAADFTATLEVTPQIAGLKPPPTQGQGFVFHKLQLQTIRN